MAYIIGFFVADGNMVTTNRGTHFISFYSRDKGILEKIQEVMESKHKLSKKNSEKGFYYRFQIGSKEIYEDLLILGLRPNKSKRLKLPRIPQMFVSDFIRGYFDGDGNVWFGMNNNDSVRRVQVSFTSVSNDFLSDLLETLKSLGIKGGSIFKVKNKNCSRLTLSTLDALKMYEIMYNVSNKLYLKRKKLVFEKIIKMRL